MAVLDSMVKNLHMFPEIGLKSSMLKPLNMLYPDAEPGRYLGASIIISLVLSIFFFLFSFLLFPEYSILVFLASFLLLFIFIIMLPKFELSKRSKIVEAEMPFTLRTIAILIDMKIPFMKSVALVSEEDSTIAREFRHIVKDVGHGVTVEKAFSRFAVSFSSFPIKRSISQLLSAYEVGSSGAEIKRIGDELLSVQQHQLKEHASKSAIFGMLFIMTAAILPTFFLVYVMMGEFGVGGQISEAGIAISLLLVFPAISVFLLLLSKSTVPYSPLTSQKNVMDITILMPALLFVISFVFFEGIFRYIGLAVGTAVMLWAIYRSYKREKRTEEIEQYLPDALFTISSLPKSVKTEKIFESIEKAGYGALSEEAAKSKRQISMNVKIDDVLDDLWKRNDSPALKKAAGMLKHVFHTNSYNQLHTIAEDLLKNFEIRRERANLMSMQKYTVLFGAVLIPMILKIALSLMGSMMDFFDDSAAAAGLLEYTNSVIPGYLVLYALISSFYAADIEGKKSMAAIYFLGMVIVSILIFTMVSF